MAGEVFIARQDTLEAVKGTVDGIDSGVKQTNNALGNFSGGGTDTVKKELQTLKDSVAQLQTKSDRLQSLVEQLMNKGGGITSCIRHIQRGDIDVYSSSTKDIPLSGFTDFNKMIAIVDSSVRIRDFNKSQLSLRTSDFVKSSSIAVYYQVIEFY